MRTRLSGVGLATLAIAVLLVGTYALAQRTPDRNQQGGGCPCPGMGGGMGGMMGGQGQQGMMGGMMGCPMMMGARAADVKVEKTPDGAVIRVAAKDAQQVDNIQRMALMMGLCMGADAGALMPTSPDAGKPQRK